MISAPKIIRLSYYLDYYSYFFEVDSLTTKTAKKVLGKVEAPPFARYYIPNQVFSDNESPFSSSEFEDFTALRTTQALLITLNLTRKPNTQLKQETT